MLSPGIQLAPAPPSPTAPGNHAIKISLHPAQAWPKIAPIWARLAEASPYASFYLSVDWVSAWLEIFAAVLQPQFLVFEEHGEPVGICLLNSCTEKRGPFRVRRLYLNTGGEDLADRTLMEFNNLVCRPGYESAVARALASHLDSLPWDEFAIEGISPGPVLDALRASSPKLSLSTDLRPDFYVDLGRIRRLQVPYLDLLSANTRSQIRRTLNRYALIGPVRAEIAPDPATAEAFFAELCCFHQARWKGRGESGAFPPGRRLDFHRALLRRAVPTGGVHLLRVTAGDQTIGVLYNFLHRGKVYFFQSGFNYGPDKQLQPGLATHALAVQHYLDLGFSEYDFLVGEARYKRSLATGSRSLAWVVFSRRSPKLAAIELLRSIKRRFNPKQTRSNPVRSTAS